MSRMKVEIKEKPAGDQIYAWATAGNFPKERAGLEALGEALQRAAMDSGMMMSAIVAECLASSAWCPTPFDLRNIATSMKQRARDKKQEGKRGYWERTYGPANPQYAQDMLARITGPTVAAQKESLHVAAVKDMLFYTEGEGRELGDRKYWEEARSHDLDHFPTLVDQIREAGGWRTERELANA